MPQPRETAPDSPPGSPFVGRREEMRQLLTALEESIAGRGRVVLLTGEPGVGKTRTAQELAAHAGRIGVRVLVGRCLDGDGGPAFWPWIQIVRAYAERVDPSRLGSEMGCGGALITQVIPEVGKRLPFSLAPPFGEPAQARFLLFDSLTTFFKNAARAQPLMLLIDDLHCADPASLRLLQFLARANGDAPLLVLGTYQDAEVRGPCVVEDTIAELARQPHARRLQLRGLDEDDVASLMERIIGNSPARALVARVHEETGGNPFFVTEVARLLGSEGCRTLDTGFVPSRGVREVVGRRLRRLSADCNAVLTVAAVLGREFDVGVLLRSSSLEPECVIGALEEAARAHLVADTATELGRVRFSHALIHEAVYRMLDAPRRIRLHRRVGEVLEELYGTHPESHLTELAHHFFQAAPAGEAARAMAYAERAARWAHERLAYEEAVGHYTRALQALELARPADAPRRCELLLALGGAQVAAGEAERATETFERAAEVARAIHAAEPLARAALGCGARSDPLRLNVRLIDLLEEARRALDGRDGALRARVLARLARELGCGERGVSLALEAAGTARRLGDRLTLTSVLIDKRFALWGPDDLETRLAEATEILGLAEGSGRREIAVVAHLYRVIDLLESGRIAEVDCELKALSRRAEELRQPWYLQHAAALGAMRARLDGRYEDAERLAQTALEAGLRAQDPSAPTTYAGHMANLCRERGGLADLEADFKRFARDYPALGLVAYVLPWLYSELAREVDARREFERVAARDFTDIPRDMNWLGALVLLSEACAFLGDTPRAATLYQLLQPYAARVVVVGFGALCFGSASLYLGRLAATLSRWDDAERHFDEALAVNRRLGAGPLVAHTQHAHGVMLLARRRPGDTERAVQLLQQALCAAESLGMTRLAEKVSARGVLPSAASPTVRERKGGDDNLFRWEGDYWTIAFEGAVLRLRDMRGLHYLAELLDNPGRELLAADLASGCRRGAKAGPTPTWVGSHNRRELDDAGDVLDARTIAAYKDRLQDLQDALTEAQAFNDPARGARIQGEIDFILRQLTQGVGLGGRRRKAGSYGERARVNVCKGIKAALHRVAERHSALGRHLVATVRTGAFCSYNPDPRVAAGWKVLRVS